MKPMSKSKALEKIKYLEDTTKLLFKGKKWKKVRNYYLLQTEAGKKKLSKRQSRSKK
jgi:hypothetical protein